MEFLPPSQISLIFFIIINCFVVSSVLSFARLAEIPHLKVAIVISIWLTLLAETVKSGFVENEPMPRLLFLLIFIMGSVALAAISKFGRAISVTTPVFLLVGFQSFRLPLELVLHDWVASGTIPSTMSWNGQNFDIVSGVLAILIAPVARKNIKWAWLFNIVGFALLLNVIRVAV